MLQGLRTSPSRRQPATTTLLWDLCSDTCDMTLIYFYLTNLLIRSPAFLRHGGQNPSGLRHLALPPSALQRRETFGRSRFPPDHHPMKQSGTPDKNLIALPIEKEKELREKKKSKKI
ncbi:hypothetical protein VTN00DRAFT_5581 [Thermoascus crustaceus]|uniref:uncharacterized protein n=1 Tax=Thermoascus crustaceus TaxID=5088 RepID=UPI003743F9FE